MHEISINGMESFYLKRMIRLRLQELRDEHSLLRLRTPVDMQDAEFISEAMTRKANEINRLDRIEDMLIALHKNKNPYL
jgi:hypothetical protein